MPHPTRILSTLVLLSAVTLPHSARAQGTAPKVTVHLRSTDRVFTDLKQVMDLTTKDEQKQWENIKLTLDEFLPGIDRKKPIRLDVILDGENEQFRVFLPIKNLRNFIKLNLQGFGFVVRKIVGGLYSIREHKKVVAYMRYQKRYVAIAEKRAKVNLIFNAARAAAALDAKKLSLAAMIENKAGGEAARRKSFAPIRENLQAALKARKNETAAQFTLRRKVLALELGEAERFIAESKLLALGFRLDPKTQQATLDLDLSAIPDTSLDKSIGNLSKTRSHFASVPRPPSTILSFRIHHPLDTFRRNSLQTVLLATRDAIQGDITKTASATDDQKAASTKVLDTIVSIVQDSLQKGVLDAFVEVTPVMGGNNVMVAAIRTVQGQRLRAALEAVPNSTLGADVEMDTAKEGDVSIHTLTVPAKFNADYAIIFGNSQTILIGTSSDAVWCAAGPQALASLKAAITARAKPGKPGPDPVFVDLSIAAGPWLRAYDIRMGTKGEVADRKLAIKAFQEGQDTVALRLRREDTRVIGRITLETGILRFLGKKMAQFSKENLE